MKRIKYIILLITVFTLTSKGQVSDLIDGLQIHAIQNPTQNTSTTN